MLKLGALSLILGAHSAWTGLLLRAPTRHALAAVPGDLFTDVPSAAAVGAIYLRQFPEEARSALQLLRETGIGPDEPLRAFVRLIAERRRIDLERGEVVAVAGWIMARSEARIFAAAWLAGAP
ncbi:MAG: hypothetical protein ACREFQ_14305 [Stellaceae bacterium]